MAIFKNWKFWFVVTLVFLTLILLRQKQLASIDSFEKCAQKYPVLESYPEQCNTPDGKHFVRQLSEDEQVFCTADAKLCPDGSAVGRVGPNCEFAPCP